MAWKLKDASMNRGTVPGSSLNGPESYGRQQACARAGQALREVPQKDSNASIWLRRSPGCTQTLTQRNPTSKHRSNFRDAPKPSAKRCGSRVRSIRSDHLSEGGGWLGYYHADTEGGEYWDDPSEDLLFMLIGELRYPANTFVIIEPDDASMDWFASVALTDGGAFEVEWRDMSRHDHELTVQTNIGRIAKELTIWLAERFHPARPGR
jgi:hypothetical protein